MQFMEGPFYGKKRISVQSLVLIFSLWYIQKIIIIMMLKLEEDFLLRALHVQSMFLVDCMAIYFSNDSFPPVEFFRSQFTKLITRFLSYQNKVSTEVPRPNNRLWFCAIF